MNAHPVPWSVGSPPARRPSARTALAIAIPARDEADRLPACLGALAQQRCIDPAAVLVLVLANNCIDGTGARARAMAPSLPFRLAVQETVLPAGLAHAGGARRAAMDAAAALLDRQAAPNPVLFSTDADSRAHPLWLRSNLAALAEGADAVAGRIERDAAEAALLPAWLRRREAREARYAALLDELAARVDPDPHDPWPRHAVHSGASIALTLDAYQQVGGLPALPVGEDRALFEALIRADLRVRHSPAARVIVSCRLLGRAAGGMADTLRQRLMTTDDAPLDTLLEPAVDALLRLRCRNALRRLRGGTPGAGDPLRLAVALGIHPPALREIVALPRFGEAWEALQHAAWPLRQRRRVLPGALLAETRRAAAILRAVRLFGAGDPAGIPGSAAAA